MALFQRIFQHSREKRRGTWGCGASKKDQIFESPELLTSHKCWQAPVLRENQIRLVIFQDSDLKGKKTLIDSKAFRKVEQLPSEASAGVYRPTRYTHSTNSSVSQTNGKHPNAPNIVDGYQCSRPGSDVDMLGEMLFGSIPMSSHGPMIKVHTFKMPPKLMLSRVFLLKPPKEQLETDGSDKDTISLYCADMTIPRSISANSLPAVEISHSLPIAMPTPAPSRGFDDESGEFTASGSFLSPFLPSSPGSSVSSSASNSSLHRRWLRNQVTSMEHVVRRRSSENISGAEEPIRSRKRYPKIGVAVLFTLPESLSGKEDQEFRRFFFSHFTLLESHFQRLVTSLERVLIFQRKKFISPVMEILSEFKSTVIQLYTAPRIQRPIWLNLMTYPKQRSHLCEHLIRELGSLLDLHNNKINNFFISRLLSSVLMHHLAWVPTVMPAGSMPSRAFLDKHQSSTLDMLAKSHPYNPLWAQLGEMYGTIGLPNKVTKTIIIGKHVDIVCRLLYVLSYFIRCSEVHEVHEQCKDIVECLTNCTLTDSDDQLLRRRTMTEESVFAKTEDSGIADVGLMQNDSREKTIFYIQEKAKCDPQSSSEETKSDDGVSLCGELRDADPTKHYQCIQEANKCNHTSVNFPGMRTASEFKEIDEVFKSDMNSSVKQQPQVRVKVDARTNYDIPNESLVKVQQINDRNANTTDNPVIMCKAMETSMLTSKMEVATPVGRASRNIEDLLRFDIEQPLNSKEQLRDVCDMTTCRKVVSNGNEEASNRNLQISALAQECINSSLETLTSSTSSQITISLDDVPSTAGTLSPHKCQRVSDSINIIPNSCQGVALSSSRQTQLGDTAQDFIAQPTTANTSLTCCDGRPAKQNCRASRLDSYEGPRRCSREELYHRSVSRMSGVSCASSMMSHLSDHACPDHEELPLASSEQLFDIEIETTKSHLDNFGRSLLGGYSHHFVPDFALQGLPQLDLRRVEKSLLDSAQHPVLDDSVLEAAYIVANTDTWTVEVVSCERFQGCGERPTVQEVHPSTMVDQLLDSVKLLHHMKLSSDFCLMHLEDRLQEVYFRSTSVARYLDQKPTAKAKALAGAVGVDCTDLPLLLAVAGVHSPHVIANVMRETIEQQRMAVHQDSP